MEDNSSPFCQIHPDYINEIVCFDYITEDCGFLCKKCYRLKENKHMKEISSIEYQNKFLKELQELKGNLLNYKNEKINMIVEKFKKIISRGFEEIYDQFGKAINQIDEFNKQLQNLDLEQKQKKIEDQKKELQNLRNQSIPKKVEVLQGIKNKLFDEIFNLEEVLFSEHLFGQQLYEIPDLKVIFKNFDVNNLLLSFEQVYHKKYQFLGQNDIEKMKQEYLNELDNLEKGTFKRRIQDKSEQINIELESQKRKMLARFFKYQRWIEQTLKNVQEIRDKFPENDDEEIQLMKIQDFNNLKKINIAIQKNKNFIEELRETASKMCHLGQYDIKISLQTIESNFMVKFIPIKMLYNFKQMPNNLIQNHPIATSIQCTDLNEHGNLNGQGQINEDYGKRQINVKIKDERQVGYTIQNIQNESLFNIDLSRHFPQNQNRFNYTKKKHENGIEEYLEENNLWELKQESNQKWTFIINSQKQNSNRIKFEDIIIDQLNQVDQNCQIKIIYSQNKIYEGQINNCFQQSGQGTLTDNEIVKSGTWKNGKLEGQGFIIQKQKKIYKGDFVNDLKQGQGLEYIIQDLYYEGQFERDQKHGNGKIIKKKQIDDDDHTLVEDNIKWKNGQPLEDLCKVF